MCSSDLTLHKLFCEIFRDLSWDLFTRRKTNVMPTRRAPQTITLLSDLIVSRSQPVSSVSVWTLSPLDRLVRLCSWVYLSREHYQQLMQTTWLIRDCSKVVSLFILQNSRLPISSQLDCQFQARIKQLSQTIL